MKSKILFIIILGFLTGKCNENGREIKITVHDEVQANIDHRIFGQFLEKPSWVGEIGPEAALKPGTHELQEGVVDLMKKMEIPVIRFPGGTDVNLQDWTTMIDNVPGRDISEGRPLFVGSAGDTVSNMFGYDEMFQLAETLDSEVMLVVNFGDAYHERVSLEEAVMHEAGLLAYANAELGADLPEGMPDWPEVRAMNGHPEPFGAKYIQIANEPWVMDGELRRMGSIDPDLKEHYFTILEAFIKAFKEVDPDIRIIADGNSEELTLPMKEMFGDQIDYLSYHTYNPWGISEVFRGDEEIPASSLSVEDIWTAWVTVPGFNSEGMSVLDNNIYNMVKSAGYPVAVTEWNWNGWWETEPEEEQPLESHFIKGVGAAGYIHALMREGNMINIGNQSMLVGNSWGITGIRVSPGMEFEPHPWPTGQITGFYSRYHGGELLATTFENIPRYDQPFKMSGINPVENVALVDVVATRSEEKVFLHVINRHYDEDMEITVDMDAMIDPDRPVIHRMFEGNIDNTPCKEQSLQPGCFKSSEIEIESSLNHFTLPQRTVSIIEFER